MLSADPRPSPGQGNASPLASVPGSFFGWVSSTAVGALTKAVQSSLRTISTPSSGRPMDNAAARPISYKMCFCLSSASLLGPSALSRGADNPEHVSAPGLSSNALCCGDELLVSRIVVRIWGWKGGNGVVIEGPGGRSFNPGVYAF